MFGIILSLPLWVEHLVQLDRPWAFAYLVLDGKHMTGAGCEGTIIQLSTSGAVIRTDEPLALLSNLKMMLTAPEDRDEVVGDLYAKVVEDVPGQGGYKVRFTAVPEEVAAAIEHACAAGKEVS